MSHVIDGTISACLWAFLYLLVFIPFFILVIAIRSRRESDERCFAEVESIVEFDDEIESLFRIEEETAFVDF